MKLIFPTRPEWVHDPYVADPNCPRWCVAGGHDHGHHVARDTVVTAQGLTWPGDQLAVIVTRLDESGGGDGHSEIEILDVSDDGRRELFSAMSPASARQLAAALLEAADVAERGQ